MRTLSLRALAAGAAVLLAIPALAQFPGRGGFGPQDPAMLLLNKGVQDELKLSDSQKEELHKISEKQQAARQKAFESGDREKGKEAMRAAFEESRKEADKVREALKPEQGKRLHQIELQVKGVRAFADPEVQNQLKLSDKQKEEIKEVAESTEKDLSEVRQGFREARGNPEKMKEIGKKVQALSHEGMEKISGLLTADQKNAWKEMTGEKFELKMEGFGGGRRGGRQNKGD